MSSERAAEAAYFALIGRLERQLEAAGADATALRLRHTMALSFPAADVESVSVAPDGATEVTSAFFGLTGSVSPLPEHLTEMWTQHDDAPALHALFGLWHHRLLSLLVQTVGKHRPADAFRRGGTDAWSGRLQLWSRASSDLPAWRRLAWWPELARRSRSRGGLRRLLGALLSEHVAANAIDIETMTGGCEPLCADQHQRLGLQNHGLGETAVLGAYLDAPASAFRVRLGPLGAAARAWIMRDETLMQIRALLALYTPPGTRAQLRLTLEPGAHPGWPEEGACLGGTSWLGAPAGITTLDIDLDDDLSRSSDVSPGAPLDRVDHPPPPALHDVRDAPVVPPVHAWSPL